MCCGSASPWCGFGFELSLWCGSGFDFLPWCGSGSRSSLRNKGSNPWKRAHIPYRTFWLCHLQLMWIRIRFRIQLITFMGIQMRIRIFIWYGCGFGCGFGCGPDAITTLSLSVIIWTMEKGRGQRIHYRYRISRMCSAALIPVEHSAPLVNCVVDPDSLNPDPDPGFEISIKTYRYSIFRHCRWHSFCKTDLIFFDGPSFKSGLRSGCFWLAGSGSGGYGSLPALPEHGWVSRTGRPQWRKVQSYCPPM